MDAARLVALIRPHFEETGTRWALAGGFAVAVWGSGRTTFDLDLVVDETNRKTLLERLAREGFVPVFDGEGFTNLEHADAEIRRLDLIWLEGETSRKIFAAAIERPGPDGRPILVVSPQHLIVMKVKAIKNAPTRVFRDSEDLRLLLARPDIDQNEVRAVFERNGLLELYERIRTTS